MTSPSAIFGLRILVVEDEALIAEEISDRLRRAGCEIVATADTGRGAIDCAIALLPDLILMDIRLKGDMDGIHAVELIHARASIPVVFLTAHSDEATLQRVKASLAFGYVLKPFHVRNLIPAIELAVDRARAHRQFEESQLSYASILRSSTDGLIATDAQGLIRFMNPAAERLTGVLARDAIGRPSTAVLRLISDSMEQREKDPVTHVLATLGSVTLQPDEFILAERGGRIPVEGTIAPVIDNLDRLIGATVTLRDVSGTRAAQAAVRAAAARLRAVVDTAVDGVMLLDAAGRVLMFNAACARLFGCSPEEMSGRPISNLMVDVLAEELGRAFEPFRSPNQSPLRIAARPTRGHRKDGSTFPAELSIGEASEQGQPVFVAVVRDNTERRELEVALLDAVSNEQRRFGRDLHDSLGQDLTGLSLLMSAFARSARHEQHPTATDFEHAHAVVASALRSCREIARGLLPVTETQGGLVSGLRDLVERLNSGVEPRINFRSIEGSEFGLSAVASDHLYRIAQEALANAIKHAHAHLIEVTLDVKPASVRLEICDDGEGEGLEHFIAAGLGMKTMRYRASLLGARFQILPSRPAGTCVVCECPQAA